MIKIESIFASSGTIYRSFRRIFYIPAANFELCSRSVVFCGLGGSLAGGVIGGGDRPQSAVGMPVIRPPPHRSLGLKGLAS